MNTLLRLVVFVIGLLFVTGNVYFLVKKKVTERTSIIWFATCLLAFLVAAFPMILNRVASWVGVDYPPSLLYLVAILVLFSMVLYQSIQLTTLELRVREIGQTLALVESEIKGPLTDKSSTSNREKQIGDR